MSRLRPDSPAATAILVGLVAMQALSTDLYLPSLPSIARDFAVDVAAAQLTLSVFLVGVAFGQLALGPLSDRFGRRPVLLGGLALYVASSAACALAASIDQLVAARAVQAVGACTGVVVGRATVRDVHGREGAARVLALIGSAVSVVPMLGPIAGGFVEASAGWRWNFVLLTASGAALVGLVALRLPETNAWRDPRALDARRLVVNFTGFLSTPGFMRYALAVAFSFAGLFSFISGSSFVFVDVLGVDPRAYGFWFALAAFGYFTGTRIAGHFTLRLGIAGMMPIACAVMVAGGLAMAGLALAGFAARESLGAPAIGLPMYVYMVGFGISWPHAQAGAIGPYPGKAGAASATLGFLQTAIAAVVGIGVGHLHDGTARPMALAIALAALATAGIYRLLAPR